MQQQHNTPPTDRQSLGSIYVWIHRRAEYLRKQARLKAEAQAEAVLEDQSQEAEADETH